jgi:AcrR family transcriptional regulator
MNARFEKIPPTQRQRVLEAAMTEFAAQGYRRASTNAIVAAAGIPKGTLFYFFGSKRGLFLYLLDAAVADYVAFIGAEKGPPPPDLFERLLQREQLKLRFAAANPLAFRFFAKAFLDIPRELRPDLESRFLDYHAASADDLADGLDVSRFREGVDLQDAIRLVQTLLEGVFARYAPRLRDAPPEGWDSLTAEISAECRRYFALLRSGLYR